MFPFRLMENVTATFTKEGGCYVKSAVALNVAMKYQARTLSSSSASMSTFQISPLIILPQKALSSYLHIPR